MRYRDTCCVGRILATALLLTAGLGGPAFGGPDDKPADPDPRKLNGTRHSIEARVIYPNRALDSSIQAELQPGPFTIPEGYKAVDLKFGWQDPKTGTTSDKLRPGHIKCVKSKRPPKKADFKPGMELPAGEYLLIVGGFPGATGVLNYTLMPDTDAKPENEKPNEKSSPDERIIDVVTWVGRPNSPDYNPKLKATYRIRGGKVLGTIDQVVEPPKYEGGITCDPLPTKGSFTGTIEGNVITGKWDVKTAAHKMHFPARDTFPAHDRTDTFTQTYDMRLVLNGDGTLSESLKGSGVTAWTWGATSPGELAGKSGEHRYEFAVPGEHQSQPMQGTWKERR